MTTGAPWLVRREWAERRIPDGGRAGAWFFTGFALFWNTIAWTIAVVVWRQAGSAPEAARYFVLIFPLVGILLLLAAGKSILHQLRYGVSVLELATLPAPPGRVLAGVIETRGLIAPAAGFRVRLSCLHRTIRGSGKNRSTSEDLLWQDERIIPGAIRQGGGIGIPFALPIPAEARETSEQDPRDRILWRLTIDADVPGVDYNVGFEVPVFRTPESDTPLTAEEIARLDPSALPSAPVAASRIGVTRRGNSVELEFPSGRAPPAGWGLVIATLVWTGIIVLMLRLGVPVFMALIFGLFDLVLLFAIGQLFLLATSVRAEPGLLAVRSSLLGIPLGARQIEARRVARIEPEPGFRSGSDTTWDLALWQDTQQKTILGRTIPTRREAEWLATELRKILSPPA